MPFIFAREAPKLWRKVCAETSTELSLLAGNWKFVLAGLIFQYLHGVAAHGVHYLHQPGPTLQDAGFFLLPELGQAKNYLSETFFAVIFFSFILWTFHPFVFQLKKIYTVLIWCRVFVYLAVCQMLRIITFYSTLLPGPSYHCREKYGTRRCFKQLAWSVAVVQSLLILTSRKHYTVDVVVAWYTVNLVVFFIDQKLPELPDRSTSQPLLPMSTREKDSKNREELDKFLNGNSANITT